MPDAAREASRIAPSGADASISTNATFAASSAVFARRQCGHPLVVTNATTGAEGADDDASSERASPDEETARTARTARGSADAERRDAGRGDATARAAKEDVARDLAACIARGVLCRAGATATRGVTMTHLDASENSKCEESSFVVVVVSRRRRGVCSTRRDVNSHPSLGASAHPARRAPSARGDSTSSRATL